MPASAAPTSTSLWLGRIFTVLVFAVALVGAALSVAGLDGAGAAFVAATLLYIVGATALWLRGDYILRMFGRLWPIALAQADEMQKAQRQQAFSFTFLVFLSVFSLGLGMHLGIMLNQHHDGDPVTGLWPSDPMGALALILTVFFALTLAPQAYLAWTLSPLDDADDELEGRA